MAASKLVNHKQMETSDAPSPVTSDATHIAEFFSKEV